MNENEKICKAILVGESGVGKTSIIVRFISDDFSQNLHSTTGASYASKIIDFNDYGKKVQFQIWDTAGQEKYRGLTKIFYKDAKIVILVYDITKRQSFDEIKKYLLIKFLGLLGINVIYLKKNKLLKMKLRNLQKVLGLFFIKLQLVQTLEFQIYLMI